MTGFILKAQVVAIQIFWKEKLKIKTAGFIFYFRVFTIDGQIDIVTLYRYVQFLM